MKKHKKYLKLKEDLKGIAEDIRFWKKNRKQGKRLEVGIDLWTIESTICVLKKEFRYKHVIYCCDMRGRLYDEVERKCHIPLDTHYINVLRGEWLDEEQETLCSGA